MKSTERVGIFQGLFIVQSLLQAELDLPQSDKVRYSPLKIIEPTEAAGISLYLQTVFKARLDQI